MKTRIERLNWAGIFLMIFGFLYMLYNWMNAVLATTILQQQLIAIRTVAAWMFIIFVTIAFSDK